MALSKSTHFILALILAVSSYYFSLLYFEPSHARLIGSIVFLVTLWTNEALPLGAVSLLPLILFPSLEILNTNQVASNYSRSIIFLFLGGFMLALAVQKTGLHKYIAHFVLAIFPNTPRGIIFSLALTSALLSAFLSNTTTALLLISIALYLTDDKQLKIRLVLAIAYGASIGGILTPIGTPPNLILLGFLESQAIEAVTFVHWTFLTAPLALAMLFVIGYVLSMGIKAEQVCEPPENRPLTQQQRTLLWILAALVVLLLVNSPIKPFYNGLGLNEKGILLGFGLLMFAPKLNFLTWEDSRKIPYEIIFLFGAGFSIASAFIETGFAMRIAEMLTAFSHLPTFALILIIAAFVTFTTEITSNTALVSMILPVIYTLTQAAGLPPLLFLMVATICASYAFMLPIATPPNAIAMSSGVVRISDMAVRGFMFNLAGILLISIFAMFYWSQFLA